MTTTLTDDLDNTTSMAAVIDISIRMWPDVDSKLAAVAAYQYTEGNITTGAYVSVMEIAQRCENNRRQVRT